jgi:RND family efflux transporter MFP subunit
MSEKGSRDELKAGNAGVQTAPATARLCYVDDSRTSAYVVRRMLQPFGYQVDHFSSAEPAFVALIQEDYDLLLTDLKVSSTGMDGDDLIRTLRQSGHPKISHMPIIVITGATDPQTLVKVYDDGANQIMNKPVDADELDGHIRRLLDQQQNIAKHRIPPRFAETEHVDQPRSERPQGSEATVVPLHRPQRVAAVSPPAGVPGEEIPVLDSQSGAAADAPDSIADNGVDRAQTPEAGTEALTADTALKASPADDSFAAPPVSDTVGSEQAVTNAAGTDAVTGEGMASSEKLANDEPNDSEAVIAASSEAEPTISSGAEQVAHDKAEPTFGEADIGAEKQEGTARPQFDESILDEMDKYALVISERRGLFGGAGPGVMVRSLVELVGFRSLLIRALIFGLLIVVALAGWRFYFDKGLPVETAFVESGEIFQSITVPGRVVSKQRVNVSAARAGQLVSVKAKEGDRVEAGQLLAKLDDRELLSRLNQARANLKNAREGIVLAERTLKRLRKAQKNGAVARRFVEDAEVDLQSARSRAGIAVEEVRSATLQFEKQKITAPFAGTVTARFAEIGQWVGPSETLFTLVDETQREIEVRVDAADSVAVDVGQVVAVSSDAFPGLEWQESVMRLGTATDNNRNTNAIKVYISLGDDAPSLRMGQQVDADIRTAWNPNTLKIPFEALINRDGQTMVAVLEDGHVRMKPVETGIEDFSMAEIKQGLNDGEMVILTKGRNLQNGDRVYPARDGE